MADFNHNRRSTLLLGDLSHTRLSIGMDVIFTKCRNMRPSGPGHKDDRERDDFPSGETSRGRSSR